jgi:hypothetical protein
LTAKEKIVLTKKKKIREVIERRKGEVLNKWKEMSLKKIEKSKDDVKMKISIKNAWDRVIENIRTKMAQYIKKELEREKIRKRDQKLKRLRHKWIILITKKITKKKEDVLKLMEKREMLIKCWKGVVDVKRNIVNTIKNKLEECCEKVSMRKNVLNKFLNNLCRKSERKNRRQSKAAGKEKVPRRNHD